MPAAVKDRSKEDISHDFTGGSLDDLEASAMGRKQTVRVHRCYVLHFGAPRKLTA
jgi:hypothetical protein